MIYKGRKLVGLALVSILSLGTISTTALSLKPVNKVYAASKALNDA